MIKIRVRLEYGDWMVYVGDDWPSRTSYFWGTEAHDRDLAISVANKFLEAFRFAGVDAEIIAEEEERR